VIAFDLAEDLAAQQIGMVDLAKLRCVPALFIMDSLHPRSTQLAGHSTVSQSYL
jgi:hypothetical protein